MTYVGKTMLTGKSGAEYAFTIFPRATTFLAKGGVYVMGRAGAGGRYEFCYVGHTHDLSVRPFNDDKTPCFNSFGVDHIFLIEELDAKRRAAIAADLVEAYAPVCNTP